MQGECEKNRAHDNNSMTMTRSLTAIIFCIIFNNAAHAEVQYFDLTLGQQKIGALSFDTETLEIVMDLNDTPFGIADGYFNAQSATARSSNGTTETRYLSQSKKRQISFVINDGKVSATAISPIREATPLSQPEAVPPGVIPLTEGFATIATATSCPNPITIYDGRRIVQIATQVQSIVLADIKCEMDYRVTAGPGHISPFRFRTLDMTLTYRDNVLALMAIKAGVFELRVVRQ